LRPQVSRFRTQGEPPYILSVRFKIEELDAKAGALKAKPQ
jgi:hypothetical protein